jgi:hypothetical protein
MMPLKLGDSEGVTMAKVLKEPTKVSLAALEARHHKGSRKAHKVHLSAEPFIHLLSPLLSISE